MVEQKWFTTVQAAPLLAMKSAEAVRNWIQKGWNCGWLKLGVHIKPRFPGLIKPQWLIHVERCQNIGDRRKS